MKNKDAIEGLVDGARWVILRQRDNEPLEVFSFEDEDQARAAHAQLGFYAQTYLCEVRATADEAQLALARARETVNLYPVTIEDELCYRRDETGPSWPRTVVDGRVCDAEEQALYLSARRQAILHGPARETVEDALRQREARAEAVIRHHRVTASAAPPVEQEATGTPDELADQFIQYASTPGATLRQMEVKYDALRLVEQHLSRERVTALARAAGDVQLNCHFRAKVMSAAIHAIVAKGCATVVVFPEKRLTQMSGLALLNVLAQEEHNPEVQLAMVDALGVYLPEVESALGVFIRSRYDDVQNAALELLIEAQNERESQQLAAEISRLVSNEELESARSLTKEALTQYPGHPKFQRWKEVLAPPIAYYLGRKSTADGQVVRAWLAEHSANHMNYWVVVDEYGAVVWRGQDAATVREQLAACPSAFALHVLPPLAEEWNE